MAIAILIFRLILECFQKSAIGVRSKSPIPTRQKICQSIGNKNSRVSITPLGVLFNFDRSCAHDWVHRLPYKKPRGQELTEAQREENREFSRQRVICEHAGIKRCRSVADVYRNRGQDFDDRLMLNIELLFRGRLKIH